MIRQPMEIITEIERQCLIADRAIGELSWVDCEASWALQAKLGHELEIALRDVRRDSPALDAVRKSIGRVVRYRDGQIERLRALKATIGKQLATIERFRALSKTIGTEQPSALLDVTT